MFSKMLTMKSTEKYLDRIDRLKHEIRDVDAILIGAGAGLSTAAGLTYSGERFRKYFSDFADKYGIRDMYSGGFILLTVWKNIGRGGADIYGITVISREVRKYTKIFVI